jgi:hypothetical protein
MADEVLPAVLPTLPEGPNGSERFVDREIDRVWDLRRDLVILAGPTAPRHAGTFRARGYRRVISVSEQNDRSLKDLERALLALREDAPARFVCLSPGAREAFAAKVREHAGFMLQAIVLGDNFTERLGVERVANCIRNIPRLSASPDLGALSRTLAGRPGLIVCPGPSLQDTVGLIAANRGRFAIIAVSHALGTLRKNGIHPDFLVALDPAPYLAEQLEGLDLGEVASLVLCPSVTPRVWRLPSVRHVIRANFHAEAEAWLDPWVGGQTCVDTGGTVAHAAAGLAVRMGCNPVIFVGQDLAYRGNQLYASETVMAPTVSFSASDNTVSEGGTIRQLVEVRGWAGERLASSAPFDAYRRWYEHWIPTQPQVRFINCSEGGAHIQGMRHAPLAKVLETLPMTHIDVAAILGAASRNPPHLTRGTILARAEERLAVVTALRMRITEARATGLTWSEGSGTVHLAEGLAADVLRAVTPGEALAAPEFALAFEHARRTFARDRADSRGPAEVCMALLAFLGECLTICQTLEAAWQETRAALAEASDGASGARGGRHDAS